MKFCTQLWMILLFFALSKNQLLSQNDVEACLSFEELEVGQEYGRSSENSAGDVFMERADVIITLDSFIYENGNGDFWNVTVLEEEEGLFNSIGDGQTLFVSNINMSFDFSQLPNGVHKVCLEIWDGGGNENFAVNNQDIAYWEFSQQMPTGEIAPGVFATFTPNEGNEETWLLAGELCLEGPINNFTIGGQEFIIDNVCFEYLEDENCGLDDFVVEPLPCTPNGIFYVEYDFSGQGPQGSNGYKITAGEQEFGPFTYFEEKTTLGPFTPGSSLAFKIEDISFPDCQTSFQLPAYSCAPQSCLSFEELEGKSFGGEF